MPDSISIAAGCWFGVLVGCGEEKHNPKAVHSYIDVRVLCVLSVTTREQCISIEKFSLNTRVRSRIPHSGTRGP